ncbi:hypothetical protein [Methanosphaera sp. BMS]|uniref:hypothetical protein n=1 Tax=Methanosphaera sp. BMS TaxID=1789762 RepID=UPI000DC1ECE0|nr:hypothetical protein [Methanosphaera sp. BMS]AWX32327.1 hypothetical protein AW729_04045 [Methanosphaera sp. BMS]
MDQKKLILGIVGIIVVLALALVAFMVLFPDEETVYNEKMAQVSIDMETIENQTKALNINESAEPTVEQCDQMISLADNMSEVIKNDTEILVDLNNSVKNQTRKEYIGAILEYFNQTQSGIDDYKEVFNAFKDYKSGKIGQSEAFNKITQIAPKFEKKDKDMNQTVNKITKMENDYPFLLSYTNGTSLGQVYANDTTNNTTTA